jgi:hypothetical protein
MSGRTSGKLTLEAKKQGIFMQYSIVYETLFGEYERRCAWWISGTSFAIVDEPDYDSDKPVSIR